VRERKRKFREAPKRRAVQRGGILISFGKGGCVVLSKEEEEGKKRGDGQKSGNLTAISRQPRIIQPLRRKTFSGRKKERGK